MSLDVVKAILIVCVVLGHAMREGTCSTTMNTIVGFIYHFHMPLFVLIVGYFFKLGEPHVMIRKICLRYCLPYVSGGILFAVGIWAFKDVSFGESACNLMAGRGLGAMWFLYTIAFIETILCVSYAAFMRSRELGLLVAIGLFAVAIELPIRVESWSVFYFLCGMLLKGNMSDCRWGAIFGFIAVAIYCVIDLPWYTELSAVSMIFVACIGILLRWCAEWLLRIRVGHLLAWLGQWTLMILIFHPLFNLALSRTAPFFASIDRTGVSFWIAETLLGIVGCLCVGNILQRTKFGVLFGVRA